MMEIHGNSLVISFKKKSISQEPAKCLELLMAMLHLSKEFRVCIDKKQMPGKKMNKTGRLRTGINHFVNREGVDSETINRLIGLIRRGQLHTVRTNVNNKDIALRPESNMAKILHEVL